MSHLVLMVGTRKGAFFLETDADRTDWTVRGPTLKGWDVSDVMYDDRAEPRMLAGVGHFVYGPTIHRSDDLGESWEQVPESPAYAEDADHEVNQVWSIVPGRDDEPGVFYAGVDEAGLFRSDDGGERWTEVPGFTEHETRSQWHPGKGGLCCHSVLPHPTDPDRMWVGVSAVGVFRTDDGGETWALKNDGLEVVVPDEEHDGLGSCVHRLILDPTDPDRLFQQNHRGTFRSTDAADSWQRIDDGLPSTFGFPIVGHPRDPDTLYTVPLESDEYRTAIGGEPAVYRTTDAGDTWQPCAEGLPDDSWVTVLRHAMATDGLDPAGVYVGTTGGRIFHSADDGDAWAAIDCNLPRINSLAAVVIE